MTNLTSQKVLFDQGAISLVLSRDRLKSFVSSYCCDWFISFLKKTVSFQELQGSRLSFPGSEVIPKVALSRGPSFLFNMDL